MTDLDLAKKHKIELINLNTNGIINMGYYCSQQNLILPMGVEARNDYDMLDRRSSSLTFPLYLATNNIYVYAVFQNASELATFMQSAFNWTVAVKLSGSVLIQQVLQCTTISQVEAIVDSREWEDFI